MSSIDGMKSELQLEIQKLLTLNQLTETVLKGIHAGSEEISSFVATELILGVFIYYHTVCFEVRETVKQLEVGNKKSLFDDTKSVNWARTIFDMTTNISAGGDKRLV